MILVAIMLEKASRIKIVLVFVMFFFVSVIFSAFCRHQKNSEKLSERLWRAKTKLDVKYTPDEDVNQKLIFIGGMPRSGTTLMRKMIESHPDIRCGPESHVIPVLIFKKEEWTLNEKDLIKLVEAGIAPRALDAAMAKFILSIIVHHAPPAKYYCNKDPLLLTATRYVHQLFPNSKFIMMLRDGRATAHSIVSKKVRIGGYNCSDYRNVLMHWNEDISKMHHECMTVGPDVCYPIHYEKLVLRPVENTKKIFKFLEIPWCKEVLHHEQHVNETALSLFELSTDQVKQPLYLDALTSWFGKLPEDVERDMPYIAPMLKILGYDPNNREPTYGKPDDFVSGKLKI